MALKQPTAKKTEEQPVWGTALKPETIGRLKELENSAAVIMGIGNALKGDDAAGPCLCGLLKDRVSARLIDAGTVPENYIQRIVAMAPEHLLVVDAMDFGGTPGSADIFEPERLCSAALSTHSVSPRLFVDVVRGQIDIRVLFLGIQPEQVRLGTPLSPSVEQTTRRIAQILRSIFPLRQ